MKELGAHMGLKLVAVFVADFTRRGEGGRERASASERRCNWTEFSSPGGRTAVGVMDGQGGKELS